MAIKAKDIYQGRKKSRFRFGIVIAVVLVIIVALILLFYGLRTYCVYDENGNATLILPFSQKAADGAVKESQTPSPSASPEVSPSESPEISPSVSPEVGTTNDEVADSEVSPPVTETQSPEGSPTDG